MEAFLYSNPLRLRLILEYHIIDHYPNFYKHSCLKDLISFTLADIICQPAFIAESIYVLQNRLPQFQAYSNILKLRLRSYNEISSGHNHFFINFLMLLGSFNFIYSIFPESLISSQAFCYPVLPSMRRLVCQTHDVPGMLPIKYRNLLHALVLIKK